MTQSPAAPERAVPPADDARHMRYHAEHAHLGATFGSGSFGAFAEATARFFGTPQ